MDTPVIENVCTCALCVITVSEHGVIEGDTNTYVVWCMCVGYYKEFRNWCQFQIRLDVYWGVESPYSVSRVCNKLFIDFETSTRHRRICTSGRPCLFHGRYSPPAPPPQLADNLKSLEYVNNVHVAVCNKSF